MALQPNFALGPPPQAVQVTFDARTNQYINRPNPLFYVWTQRLFEWTKTLGNNIDGDASFSGSIAIGTSPNWFNADSSGIWLGGATFAASPFSVSMAGALAATSGVIGGFTLGATTLTATSGGNTTIVSSGATAFSAGPTGSPTVTITQAGVLSATGIVATAATSKPGISATAGSAASAVYGNVPAAQDAACNGVYGTSATATAYAGRFEGSSTTGSGLYVVGVSAFNGTVSALGYTVIATTFSGALTGNASGSSGSCTGNAATATALQTARTIGGVSFDGSANIVPLQVKDTGENLITMGGNAGLATRFVTHVGTASGTATATWANTTKPGTDSTSGWLKLYIDGANVYYIPVWT
mgnify:CR=1 FL=1